MSSKSIKCTAKPYNLAGIEIYGKQNLQVSKIKFKLLYKMNQAIWLRKIGDLKKKYLPEHRPVAVGVQEDEASQVKEHIE